MKKLLAVGAIALGLSGCVAVPVDDYGYGYYGYYGYGPGYGYYDPYPYWGYYGYGFGYAPYYWGPPVIIGGSFFHRDFHGHGGFNHFRGDGTHHWSGRGGNRGGGNPGGHGGHGGR